MATSVKYFVRAEDATHFNIIMRDDGGFESVVDTARNGEVAEKKAARLQHNEDRAQARASA